MSPQYTIGIDEAGRGPLAGPVAVGVIVVPIGFDWTQIENVKDSKKLSEKKREAVFARVKELQKEGKLQYAVAFSSNKLIDAHGISHAIRAAMARALSSLPINPSECEVLLDGSLRAPEQFIHQRTIIDGDNLEPAISLASICAKVCRDTLMVRESAHYPQYNFATHKGYGTATHIKLIREHGLSDFHRITFCKNITTNK